MTRPMPGPGPDADTARPAAAGRPSYPDQWALFCDYTAATGQPTLPTTVETLTGFLAALPAAPATLARRVRAIAAAHRRAGHLLARPQTGPAAPRSHPSRRSPDPGLMIAACPTRGWPAGLAGRRDAFLIVLTEVLDYTPTSARALHAGDIGVEAIAATSETAPRVQGHPVPDDQDPRRCPACAVSRWLEILGVADGLGRGSAHMDLAAAHAPTATGPHQHAVSEPGRWRRASVLLPAIDRHGWHDDYRPMSLRAIRTRRALVIARIAAAEPFLSPAVHAPDTPPHAAPTEAGAARSPNELDELLATLDALADDADALNNRIQALLTEDRR